MRSFISMPLRGKTPTTKFYFWCRMPIDVHVKATYDTYCPVRFPGILLEARVQPQSTNSKLTYAKPTGCL